MSKQQFSYGAAKRFAEAFLGGPTREQSGVVSVQTGATLIVQGNGDRVGLVLINTGAFDVLVFIDATVSSTNGVRLSGNGGSVSFNVRDDFTLQTREWWGVGIGGVSTVTFLDVDQFLQTGPASIA